MTGAATAELMDELRGLCARFPVPHPSWHPDAVAIAACRRDFERALALADSPETRELLAALVAGDAEPAFDEGASPELTAAWRRLEALSVPGGQHPYLDEILPTLEGQRLLLVALSHTTAGLDFGNSGYFLTRGKEKGP